MKVFKSRMKGLSLSQLLPAVLAFVVSFIALSFSGQILQSIQNTQTGTPAQITGNASIGLLNLASQAPNIGLVLGIAVIIGVLIGAFTLSRGDTGV